jgi:hypothetical protein
MNDVNGSNAALDRSVWNRGKLTGPKPPLRPGHVWSIRATLHLERRTRDLALFNVPSTGKLRGCDLVALRVDEWRRTDMRSTALTSARGKPVDPSGSS